ncbi:MAG: N-acetyltransferase [Bacillaceae bacterium]|jgi:RimJ/RimL family protein N-acetyltransferase|uniref:Alanine acetyltransferase n=2 Tax=Aeribacillus TaxID=1055323 RepID=A0A161ZWV4_9BACI|nr:MULTISPECIES: GNAT family N-acetyltransferase [Aeribacillus]AXI38450.1 N-acetyltransferase [Bacillaceae bacterium ZC4]REJ13606.1 MAG: N-acetyltransferase [Bacillaceae bacterium]ASS89253.1 N-acetyltransferase [Aeribacillus pallidus]KZM57174.1 alanine acetyltransferase [Aeribacillus pallidus]KZN97987.1 alanine acetyltransferase [Aeribacillus pallidus]
MLKKRDLADCQELFELMVHPEVFPYVRHKATSIEEYMFITKQLIEAEERGELISRTILDEWGSPIGTISLYDIFDQTGFLGTWLGKPYHGKGYNQLAKDAFFQEIFYEFGIQTIFMKIRKDNERSMKAAQKLPYVSLADESRQLPHIENKNLYNIFEISKDMYTLYTKRNGFMTDEESRLKEA